MMILYSSSPLCTDVIRVPDVVLLFDMMFMQSNSCTHSVYLSYTHLWFRCLCWLYCESTGRCKRRAKIYDEFLMLTLAIDSNRYLDLFGKRSKWTFANFVAYSCLSGNKWYSGCCQCTHNVNIITWVNKRIAIHHWLAKLYIHSFMTWL